MNVCQASCSCYGIFVCVSASYMTCGMFYCCLNVKAFVHSSLTPLNSYMYFIKLGTAVKKNTQRQIQKKMLLSLYMLFSLSMFRVGIPYQCYRKT